MPATPITNYGCLPCLLTLHLLLFLFSFPKNSSNCQSRVNCSFKVIDNEKITKNTTNNKYY